MEDISNNISKKSNDTERGSSSNEQPGISEICNIVSYRAAQYRNSVLASQIQKALPIVMSIEKNYSLHVVLQQISEEFLLGSSDVNKDKKKQVMFQLPKKSLYSTEITLEDYVVPGNEDKLLADSFVRNLPVTIVEKRHYRKGIALSLKRKPWHTEFHDFISKKFENFKSWFDLWHKPLKVIEGQHGAAVVAYFLFIRWLLYLNIAIFLMNFFFLVIPQLTFHSFTDAERNIINHTTSYFIQKGSNPYTEKLVKSLNQIDSLGWEKYELLNLFVPHVNHSSENITNNTSVEIVVLHCQKLYSQEISNTSYAGFFTSIQNFLQGTGPLEPTYLFLGFYSHFTVSTKGYIYNIPFAFVCVLLATFLICFIMMIQYSSLGIQEAFMARNKRSNYYSNEVFSSWDYCIDNPKSAAFQHYQFVLEMKTSLNEDRTMKEIFTRTTRTWAKLYAIRFFINIFILSWVCACYYLIYSVAVFQLRELQKQHLFQPGLRTFFVQLLSTITIVILNSISPTVFSILVSYEKYAAQTEVNLSIFRNVFLYLSSIIILLNTFYQQIACKPKDICGAGLDVTCRSPRCWETYIGQQLFKLTVMDLFVYIGLFLGYDLIHHFFTRRYDNRFTRLWGHQVFNLQTEVLAPINSQTILWLGFFYSPLLPAVMIFKLIIIFYIKKAKVLIFCNPSERSYRASRFNAVFIMVLFISFSVVFIVQCFAIENIPPSRGCGPFRHFDLMTKAVPENIRSWLSVLTSYWTTSFTTLILCLLIYHYWRVLVTQRELGKRLKAHLVLQSCDKEFLLKSIAKLTRDKSS